MSLHQKTDDIKENDVTEFKREFCIVGLGRMGANLARQALGKGMHVVGFDRKRIPKRANRCRACQDLWFRGLLLYFSSGLAKCSLLPAPFLFYSVGQLKRSGDNGQMGEGLREVAQDLP